jgi:hypothetical protein
MPPTRFGLVGPTYQAQSPNLDAQFTMNLYVEADESGAGNAPIALFRTPGTKTFVNLARAISPATNGIGAIDGTPKQNAGVGTTVSTPTATPSNSQDLALFIVAAPTSAGTITPGGSFAGFGPNAYAEAVTSGVAGAATLASSAGWSAALLLFKQFGASVPTITHQVNNSGSIGGAGTLTALSVTKGDTILVTMTIGSGGALPSGKTVGPDSAGNVYTQLFSHYDSTSQTEIGVWEAIASTTASINIPYGASAGGSFAAIIAALDLPTGAAAVTNTGPIRAQTDINGRSFAICGQDFDEIFSNGTFVTRGSVANDSLIATMAATPQQILIASAGSAYVFDLTANGLVQIPGATFSGPVAQAAVCDDFFILTIVNSKTFYVSAPLDATDWVTNGSAIVSVFPDNIVGMLVFQRQIWFDSDTQSVVYYDSGNIFPFDVNPNAFIEAGLAAENTMAIFNNSIAWLGADARGHGKVWLASGYTPTRISNHAVEFAIQGYSRIDDAVAFSYQDQGHEFYFLYFPTPSVAWIYDANTGMWHQQGFWLESVGQFRAPHRWTHAFSFGMHLVGDWQSGKIYQMQIPAYDNGAWTFGDDDGNPIRWVRRAPHVSKMQKRQFFSELQVYCETGLGPVPALVNTAIGPRQITLADETGALWNLTISDSGVINTTPAAFGDAEIVILNDALHPGISQRLLVDGSSGDVLAQATTYDFSYPISYPMGTITSGLQSALILSS